MARLMQEQLNAFSGDERARVKTELVAPREIVCAVRETNETVRLWLVYDELPASKKDGYLIVFDPARSQFGLAVKSARPGRGFTFLNYYGSFKDTLESM